MRKLQQTEKTSGIVRRETGAYYRGKAIMVELRPPALITLRLKKTRRPYTINVITAFEHAVQIAAAVEAKQRQEARKAKRKIGGK